MVPFNTPAVPRPILRAATCNAAGFELVRRSGVDNEDRAGRSVRNAVRDASKHASHALHALVPDHDQIGLLPLGNSDDGVRGLTRRCVNDRLQASFLRYGGQRF